MLVIFDVDGTLTRTKDLNGLALARAFEEVFGAPLPTLDWGQYPRISAAGLLEDAAVRAFGRLPSPEERAQTRARFIELLMMHLFSLKERLEVPGAVSAVGRLRDAGHAVAFATGDWRESAEAKLERAGFDTDEIPLAAADDALGRRDIIAEALRRAGGPEAHSHVVYVGDGVWDLTAAQSLGLAVVGVDPDDDGQLGAAGIEDVIPDFVDFHQVEAHLMRALARR